VDDLVERTAAAIVIAWLLRDAQDKQGAFDMVTRSTSLSATVLTIFLAATLLSTNAFAKKTTVTTTNNTLYNLRAVYSAVGCFKIYHSDINQKDEVCSVKDLPPGATVSYEFGGGTSGRKVWAEIVSATPEMMISPEQEAVDHWSNKYVGHSVIIPNGYTYWYDLTDHNSNSCAVKGFGIHDDAHLTWTKLEVELVDFPYPEYDPEEKLFVADCGAVVSAPEPWQVCAPFDKKGKAHIKDGLFDGKASTSSPELTEFCMALVEAGPPGLFRFLIYTIPVDALGSCDASVVDANKIKVTCDDAKGTELEGRVK